MRKTVERADYIPLDSVLSELSDWFADGGKADFITLAGSGEPTLHAGFSRVIDFVHEHSSIPVALLTNGSLLGDVSVRGQAACADLVKVSLSAWDQVSFELINRPVSGIEFSAIVDGIRKFRSEFDGRLWLEVFAVEGMNDASQQIAAIANFANSLAVDRIQLNTAVRPPCESNVRPVNRNRLIELAAYFQPVAEVIAEFCAEEDEQIQADETDILNMIRRRPCTLEQICEVFGMHPNQASKYVGKLLRTEKITRQQKTDKGKSDNDECNEDSYYCLGKS
jgi:wyosine [tRNA(Phe)-imidazoG37] synthetase (radical SAM superfamily)